ncbi:hypothetical protein T02_4023 [Trichinella nativa]|uniref:Uncharacterized protein n=1 Tax=Trichinella nativa TaxID=6335 RepID=A0A0V1L7H9_9BILA|nr:hypothetical protein T02_4023 [Trichinella nativa]
MSVVLSSSRQLASSNDDIKQQTLVGPSLAVDAASWCRAFC